VPCPASGGSFARTVASVDFGNGWNLTQDQWRQLQLIDWLYDSADGQPDRYVTIDRARAACPFSGDPNPAESLDRTFGCLYRERLVHFVLSRTAEGDVPVRAALTRAGADVVQQMRRRRADPAARRPAARDALLRWLYERAAAGEHVPYLHNFWESGYARFLSTRGDFFAIAEIDDASRWLRDEGYISGPEAAGGGIVRPRIEAKGERLVENDRSASEDRTAAGGTNITVTGSTGVSVATNSPGATQTVTVALTGEMRRQILTVADYLDQTAAQLGAPAEELARVPELIAELRIVAGGPAADRGKLRQLLDTARQLAIGAAGAPLGAGLEALVHQAARALGLS
jgi:hypothetical protein